MTLRFLRTPPLSFLLNGPIPRSTSASVARCGLLTLGPGGPAEALVLPTADLLLGGQELRIRSEGNVGVGSAGLSSFF